MNPVQPSKVALALGLASFMFSQAASAQSSIWDGSPLPQPHANKSSIWDTIPVPHIAPPTDVTAPESSPLTFELSAEEKASNIVNDALDGRAVIQRTKLFSFCSENRKAQIAIPFSVQLDTESLKAVNMPAQQRMHIFDLVEKGITEGLKKAADIDNLPTALVDGSYNQKLIDITGGYKNGLASAFNIIIRLQQHDRPILAADCGMTTQTQYEEAKLKYIELLTRAYSKGAPSEKGTMSPARVMSPGLRAFSL